MRALHSVLICQNMPGQSSKYILGFKYARILNMAEDARVTHGSKYVTIWLNM